MTIFVSSCRNKLTKKYAKKNGTPCIFFRFSKLYFIVIFQKILGNFYPIGPMLPLPTLIQL
jgi:hypothetical protein